MSDNLKSYIKKNREEFDAAEPSKDLWKKIDSEMAGKNSNLIKSKGLSKFLYLGFGASVLIIAVYFISQNFDEAADGKFAQNNKDSALNNSGAWVKVNERKQEPDKVGLNQNDEGDKQQENQNSNEKSGDESGIAAGNLYADSVTARFAENNFSEAGKVNNDEAVRVQTKDEKALAVNDAKSSNTPSNKKIKLYLPAEPLKMNVYYGTLYDSSYFCLLLREYKFPGKVSMDDGGNYTDRRIMKTTSCNRLGNNTSVKAVWLKGKSDKKITLSVSEGFANIVLKKSDGRKINPVAISHYYPGLGVISGYSGKHFNMTFKDKVELILFFKDVEAGDKISVDGIIEAAVNY